jgi:hypothetical protein
LKEAPYFGRAIAHWVLNRNRVTYWGNAQLLIADIAVALPNSITRKRLPLCGFVQVAFPSAGSPFGLDSGVEGRFRSESGLSWVGLYPLGVP